jgi:guanylate kinase
MAKFIILSGPSCIGKSPLEKALKRLYPEWARQLQKLVLYNDRSPRPGEIDGVDYHFRPHHEVEAKKEREGYIVLQVRNDLQALEIESIQRIQEAGKIPFFEGNPYLVEALQETGLFSRFAKTSIFMSPLSREEIHFFRETDFDMEKLIALIMRKKQLRRKQKQMNLLSIPDLEDVEIRCQAAYREMKLAHHYDYVIPNHDGEDSENWSDFYYPVGDARKAVEAFVSILKEEPLPYVEQWQKDLLA